MWGLHGRQQPMRQAGCAAVWRWHKAMLSLHEGSGLRRRSNAHLDACKVQVQARGELDLHYPRLQGGASLRKQRKLAVRLDHNVGALGGHLCCVRNYTTEEKEGERGEAGAGEDFCRGSHHPHTIGLVRRRQPKAQLAVPWFPTEHEKWSPPNPAPGQTS